MEILKSAAESTYQTTIETVTSQGFIAYILVNIAAFLIVKYYGLRDIRRGNKDPVCL
jgi:hypothetical protein